MRRLKSLFAIATTALAVLAAPGPASADKLKDVLGAGRLRVGILTDAAPWGFKDDKGEIAGLDADLAKLIAADMGVKLELVPVTGAARIPSLLSDKIDVLIAGLGATPERAQQIMFSQPYAVVNLGVYGPKSIAAATGKKAENLERHTVAVAKGTTLDVWLTDNAPKVKLVRFEDTPSAIAAYLAGQADSFAENSAIALKVKEQNPTKEVELKFLIRQSPAHIGLRQGEQNLLNWINTALFTNKLNGKLGELQLKWFKEEQSLPTL
ncbi:transporter substrate-binding domain-containing protein [Bradyrhizobium sp. JYMT SZCCT0428]|uniref:transporter substrate-binding domain-containing protein n=1 Tax=Bradyrhizobium sp. JYMT SZCCT0428 TaxID=2807673 RepID=UPI001BA9AA04|nr:transporter substrate-binding domain-containing protein [Bradyrhizobium sp. JYMT SZCCT0428]MBR1152049.1 transporter substrate-binding domain-containing protein [Bradyrhizobium sp. JYMT SZCCT0428]